MITIKQAVNEYAASGIHMTASNLRRIAAAWSGVVYAGQGGYSGSVVDYHGGTVPIYRTLLPTSHGMLKSYRKNMQPSLQRNSDLLASRPLERDEIPTLLEAFLRINAHGELINRQHFENIIAIAEHNPHCNVAIWTKRKDIVGAVLAKRDKPKNLILVWSNPKIDAVIYKTPANFDRVFNNVSSEHKPDEQNCTGQQCKNCLLCYKFDTAKIIIEAVKFNGRTVKGKDL